MQVLTTRSSAGGDMGCTAEMGCGSEARIAATILAWLLPVKARLPEAISYNTAPSAKMSERASASFPSSCSGDMYWNCLLYTSEAGCFQSTLRRPMLSPVVSGLFTPSFRHSWSAGISTSASALWAA